VNGRRRDEVGKRGSGEFDQLSMGDYEFYNGITN